MRVYLAGGINGLGDSEAKDWRESVKAGATQHEYLDPMRRDYRGVEDQNVRAIVDGDLADIDASDLILVMADRPSWGTAMETYYAHAVAGKRVVVVCGGRVSPWLRAHSEAVLESLEAAIDWLRGQAA